MPAQMHLWNGERAHVGQWRELDGIAVIAPIPGSRPLSPAYIEHCCTMLSAEGFEDVVTPALAPGELTPFLDAGFEIREQLYVLVHHLRTFSTTRLDHITLRRARAADVDRTLEVDGQAFDTFWRFDSASLGEACTATPHSRFRVAVTTSTIVAPGGGVTQPGIVVGYCITGRSRAQGFLQRLAVAPEAQRLGIGSALVDDALTWLERRRARTCVVNTQQKNARAMELYRRCGFEESPSGLHVLARPLQSTRRQAV